MMPVVVAEEDICGNIRIREFKDLVEFLEFGVAVFIAGTEVVLVQFIKVIQHPGATGDLRVLRARGR